MISGVVFLDKPLGWTSRRAVNEMIRLFSINGQKRIKAGHAGTLDPLATGMLPILLGEATRFADFGLQAEKTYQFCFDLSYQTDTLDNEGETIARFDVSSLSSQNIYDVLKQFHGDLEQVPPIYSAIHIGGKRAHELARQGQTPKLKARKVSVMSIHVDTINLPCVTLSVTCSKGTYIRSLARDIGMALQVGGCVQQLRRLSTGGWPSSLMVDIDTLVENKEQYIVPMATWLRDMESYELSMDEAKRFVQGQRIAQRTYTKGENATIRVMHEDTLLGLAEFKSGLQQMVLHPTKILPSAQEKLRCSNKV